MDMLHKIFGNILKLIGYTSVVFVGEVSHTLPWAPADDAVLYCTWCTWTAAVAVAVAAA